MDLQVEGCAYIVTGGTRGLGRATADQLVADGARVVVSSRHQDTVEAAVAELGDHAVGVAADNADPATPGRLVAAAQRAWGRLDGLVVSVGGPPAGTAAETTDEQWLAGFHAVFLGAVRLARETARHLDPGGSITFVLSTSVRAPITGLAVSNGLRPGLAMVAKTLADELGPRGIRVNGLLPGRFATRRVRELDAASGDAAAARERSSRAIPLGRYGEPAEFGRAAAFLASPAASYITGAMLPVDGGSLRAL